MRTLLQGQDLLGVWHWSGWNNGVVCLWGLPLWAVACQVESESVIQS